MSPTTDPDAPIATHELSSFTEPFLGKDQMRAECSCGWVSCPGSDMKAVALLWEEHSGERHPLGSGPSNA